MDDHPAMRDALVRAFENAVQPHQHADVLADVALHAMKELFAEWRANTESDKAYIAKLERDLRWAERRIEEKEL